MRSELKFPARSRPREAKRDEAGNAESKAQLAVEIRILSLFVAKMAMRDMEQRINTVLPGVSPLQMGIMRLLAHEQYTLSELSARMMHTPSTLVPAVDKLEREGLVIRGKDPNDRRRTPLILTDDAHRALNAIPPGHPDDLIVGAVSRMDIKRAMQLRTLLHELLMGMSADKGMIEDLLTNHPERKCMLR